MSTWSLVCLAWAVLFQPALAGAEPAAVSLIGPTGKHRVATVAAYMQDPSRREPHTQLSDDVRELMVQFWYPCDQPAPRAARTRYFPDDQAGQHLLSRFGSSEAAVAALARIHTAAVVAPPAELGAAIPLIIFSHGFSDSRFNNTTLMIELASHGYVTAAIDHTYSAWAVQLPDGRLVRFAPALKDPALGGDQKKANRALFDLWVADTEFVCQQLLGPDADPALGEVARIVDPDRIGIMGHSFGGGVAADRCSRDTRFRAGINLDGTVRYGAEARGLRTPFLTLSRRNALDATEGEGVEWAIRMNGFKRLAQTRPNEAYVISIAGMGHMNFCDWPLIAAAVPLANPPEPLGSIDAEHGARIMNGYVVDFFDASLRGYDPRLLRESADTADEVRFDAAPWLDKRS